MAFFEFPHTRTYDSDLGWLIKKIGEVDQKLSEYLENAVITFADPIEWNITEQYTALTMVVDSDGTAYLSRQPVPAGVDISNTDYWMPVFNYDDNINSLRSYIALNERESETASQNIAANTLVWIQGALYRTLRAISAGERFIEGTNIEDITVSAALSELQTEISDIASDIRDQIATYNAGSSQTAGENLTAGDLIYWNNVLYKVISDISAGSAFIPETNIVEINVSDRISDISGNISDIASDIRDQIATYNAGSSQTAGENLTAGDLIYWNDVLYKVVSDISAGSAFIPETNIVEINVSDRINEINIVSTTYVDPANYGAVYDGVTDDTAAFAAALQIGSIRLPAGVSTRLENLYVPDFREIDFNGSFIYTASWAIKCEATSAHGYVRNITIRNAHFIPTLSHSNAHSGGGLYLNGAIKCNLINSEMANPTEGTDLAYIKNSFNFTADIVYCGTGSNNRVANTSGIAFDMGSPVISGSDNVTNCHVSNALFQHLTFGIFVDSDDGLFDTNLFENIGCSDVGYGIYISGTSASSRNNAVNVLRVEFSDHAIYTTGYLTVIGFYATRISTAFITNSGHLTMVGDVAAYNTSGSVPLYVNTGVINAAGSLPDFLSNVTLDNRGDLTNPYISSAANSNVFADNATDRRDQMLNLFGMVTITGTSGASGGEVVISYPDGYSRDNTLILAACIYASNGQYLYNPDYIFTALASSGIVVNTSTSMTTTYNRPIYIFAMKRVF